MEAILRLKAFLEEYRPAWYDFTHGRRDTLFPAGTYWMRVAFSARCATVG